MKFGRLLYNLQVPEWSEAYFEYVALKKLLSPAKILQKKFVQTSTTAHKDGTMTPTYRMPNKKHLRIEQVIFCLRTFESLIKQEATKIDLFFQYKLLDLTDRADLLHVNTRFLRTHTDQLLQQKLKQSYKLFYKESNLLKTYSQINQTAMVKIVKKYAKLVATLPHSPIHHFDLLHRFSSQQPSSFLSRNEPKLTAIMKHTEDAYISYFYPAIAMQKNGRQDFRNYTTPKPLSPSQVLFYGVFCGISTMLFLFIVLRFVDAYTSDVSDIQRAQLSTIFPLFRGNGLVIIYFWLTAWNVSVWQDSHINYKLIFKFNNHFSQIYEILQRAAFFTFIYFICFVWYLLINTPAEMRNNHGVDLYALIDWIDPELLPLISWAILLGYICFPLTNVRFFNPKGRKYFFKLLGQCLGSPFFAVDFRMTWMTDMLVSFAGPLKDFESTVCFYVAKMSSISSSAQCGSDKRVFQIIINIFPVIYRILQCLRQGYDRKVFWNTWPFYNTIKYLFSLATSLLSYKYSLTKETPDLIAWLVVSSLSTIISFYWDIAQDWGLLVIGKTWKTTHLIGRKLCYGSRNFYLAAMFSNLLLRIVWALNISLGLTEIIDNLIGVSGMFKFIVYFLELFRRCQWNFFRVELEHLTNCKNYQAVIEINLPVAKLDSPEATYSNQLTLSASAKARDDHRNHISISPAVPLDTIEEQQQQMIKSEYVDTNNHVDQQLDSEAQVSPVSPTVQIVTEPTEQTIRKKEDTKPSSFKPIAHLEICMTDLNSSPVQAQSSKGMSSSVMKQTASTPMPRVKSDKTQASLRLFEAQLTKGITSNQYLTAMEIAKSVKEHLRKIEPEQVVASSALADQEEHSLISPSN